MMNVLVTAGNTLVPIDSVRCLTNIFTGRTGAGIALRCHDRGHRVKLLTSHPETVPELRGEFPPGLSVLRYSTFDDLDRGMEQIVRAGVDAVVHSAAVSDYLCAGVYAPAQGTAFDTQTSAWRGAAMTDRIAAKVKSDEPELWIRLTRAPKLVDRVRSEWGFGGVLVKFKLEVGVSDERLLEIARRSRSQSGADFLVANTLEGSREWAFLVRRDGGYDRLTRDELPDRLLDAVEARHGELAHG
jgi:phosphopantothenoylcysteine synthetase/decarboxylase